MRLYLSAPLFSQMERIYNRQLARAIQEALPGCEVILPQDFRLPGKHGASYNDRRALPELYRQCIQALRESDLVVARLDGADADSGTAYEVGYASALGKPVIGLRTDYRQLQSKGLNMMLACGCTEVLCRFSFNEDLADLAQALVMRIKRIMAVRRGGGEKGVPG